MTRTLEAELKLKAVDQTGRALASVSRKLSDVERKAAQVNMAQSAMGRTAAAVGSQMAAVLAPAALAYAGTQAVRRFAEVDRAMTRIGITADATDRQIKGAGKTLRQISFDTATPLDEVREGLDSLTASGRDLAESMALLPAVARTAQASGSLISDIATTATSVGDAFEIAGDKMEGAFDIMALGGKLGKFELKDMAQYLPSLAPAFAVVGQKGEEGLGKLVAMLQVVRTQTGSAGEAATAMANVLQKMETDETAKKFKKFGIDLRKEMKNARRDGKDLVEVFLDLSEKALKGDLSKIPQLFTDAQFGLGMRALLMNRKEIERYAAALKDAGGTVAGDLARVVGDTQAKLDRLTQSFDSAGQSAGKFLDSIGVSDGLKDVANFLDGISDTLDDISQRSGGIFSGDRGSLIGWLNKKSGGALNPIAADGERVGPNGQPGDFYSSDVQQLMADAKRKAADALLGTLPVPIPGGRPKRTDGAPGDFFVDGQPVGGGYGPGVVGMPQRRPPAGRVGPSSRAASRTIGARPGEIDQATYDLLTSAEAGNGLFRSSRDDIVMSPTGPVRRGGIMPKRPYGRFAGDDGYRARDFTLYSGGEFGDTGPASGAFVADRPGGSLAGLPAAAEGVVQVFGDLAAEAEWFGSVLNAVVPDWPKRTTSKPAITFDEDGLMFPWQRRAKNRDAASARRRQDAMTAPVAGDVTLGGGGGFGKDSRAAREFVRDLDVEKVRHDLEALPSAIDPGAFAAAAQAAANSISTAVDVAMKTAEERVAIGAARMQKALSFSATPRVNADVGRSMPDVGQ